MLSRYLQISLMSRQYECKLHCFMQSGQLNFVIFVISLCYFYLCFVGLSLVRSLQRVYLLSVVEQGRFLLGSCLQAHFSRGFLYAHCTYSVHLCLGKKDCAEKLLKSTYISHFTTGWMDERSVQKFIFNNLVRVSPSISLIKA